MTTRHEQDDSTEPAGDEVPGSSDVVGKWPGPRPTAVAAELRWVHDMLRNDMLIVQRLAARVGDGAVTRDVETELAELTSSGPLFRLRANCLTLCQTLDAHHQGEDAALFPAVRQVAPYLAATVDRLEEDHRKVSSLVDDVERLAGDLVDPATRAALVEALDGLAATLLAHLDLEETTLQPVLESWTSWPGRP